MHCRSAAFIIAGHADASRFPPLFKVSKNTCSGVQDFSQVLRQGLQLLRPPKKDTKDGAGSVAGSVGYSHDARMQKCCLYPCRSCRCLFRVSKNVYGGVQDFFQVLRPGLQLLRPPKKDARDGAGIIAGFVGYNYDAFKQEFGIEPWQVKHTC